MLLEGQSERQRRNLVQGKHYFSVDDYFEYNSKVVSFLKFLFACAFHGISLTSFQQVCI